MYPAPKEEWDITLPPPHHLRKNGVDMAAHKLQARLPPLYQKATTTYIKRFWKFEPVHLNQII